MRYLTCAQVAEMLGIGRPAVRRLGLPETRINQRLIRYREADVEAFLDARRAA